VAAGEAARACHFPDDDERAVVEIEFHFGASFAPAALAGIDLHQHLHWLGERA